MKYIDAEKLIAEIAVLKKGVINKWLENPRSSIDDGFLTACSRFLEIIASLQQEQPEVDLEKFTEKIKTFQGRYKYPEILSIKGAMAFMARMFYQYPNVARQWYEQLPKATMD